MSTLRPGSVWATRLRATTRSPDHGGPKQTDEIDGGRFGLLHYPSRLFDRAGAMQAEFLCRVLG